MADLFLRFLFRLWLSLG